jgi:hypothetical protein
LLSLSASFFFLFSALTHASVSSASKGIMARQCCHREISQTLRSWCAKLWRPDKTCYHYTNWFNMHLQVSSFTLQLGRTIREFHNHRKKYQVWGFNGYEDSYCDRVVWQVGNSSETLVPVYQITRNT